MLLGKIIVEEEDPGELSGFRFGSMLLLTSTAPSRQLLGSSRVQVEERTQGGQHRLSVRARLTCLSSSLYGLWLQDEEESLFPDLALERFTLTVCEGDQVVVRAGSHGTHLATVVHRARNQGNFEYTIALPTCLPLNGSPVYTVGNSALVGILVEQEPWGLSRVLGLEPMTRSTQHHTSYRAQRPAYLDAYRSLLTHQHHSETMRARLSKVNLYAKQDDT